MRKLPKRRTPRVHVATFSRTEVDAIMAVARSRRTAVRDLALIRLLLDSGIRIGEAMNLNLEDVVWIENTVRVSGKSGPRSVPFGRRTKAALKRYVEQARTAPTPRVRRLFLTRSGAPISSHGGAQQVGRIVRDAGGQAAKAGPRTFRHTFAVECIRAGGDAFSLQRLLGHSTLDMTRRYVHFADTDLRSAHRKFAVADAWLATASHRGSP